MIADFDIWMGRLNEIASEYGQSSQDRDAWFSDYEDGKSPEQAWAEEWGNFMERVI